MTAPQRSPYRKEKVGELLVDGGWLAEHLYDSNLRVVEVDVSPAAYDDWHIDGAVLWNIYNDLKDADYRLIDAKRFEKLLGRSGISPATTVVFYGYAPALALWLMKLFGHSDSRILDCSRDTWRTDGHPWATAPTGPTSATYHLGDEDGSIRADREAVQQSIARTDAVLLDVRSQAEYRGEGFWPSGGMEPGGRAGHVPSAVHQPIDGLYNHDGSFRAVAELREIFGSIDLDSDEELITYCTIGGRAATAWFVLTYLLGRDHVRVYDGSWAEWGRTADAPVETA